MPIITRSKTRGGQPPPRVTSPREGDTHPRRLTNSRQGNAVVGTFATVGSPVISNVSANGNQPIGHNISKCERRNCMTCPHFITNPIFTSNVTKKTYKTIDHSLEPLTCNSQNLVYLLSCNNCHIQYIGETTIPLKKRMNIHRTAKTGCEHMINHFREVCPGSSFSIRIIEVFKGDGYENNKVCPEARKIRVERENFWMKELRTIFPYGLNERARGQGQNSSIGKLFPSIPRQSLRLFRSRHNPFNNNPFDKQSFFLSLNNLLANDLSNAFYKIRKLLNSLRKKLLKSIANEILSNGPLLKNDPMSVHFYVYTLDIIETITYLPKDNKSPSKKKCPKNIIPIFFSITNQLNY